MRKGLRCRNAAPRASYRCRAAIASSVAALLVAGALTHAVSAAPILWIGSTSTDFGTAKNWMPQTVPGKTDTAVFDTAKGSTGLTVTGAAGFENQAIIVRNGSFSLSAAEGTYTVTAANDSVLVGQNAGDTGSLKLTAGTLAGMRGTVALAAGSTGTVTITGPNSTWSNDGLSVGVGGTGVLNLQNGAKIMDTGGGDVGVMKGSNGTATVTGGSSWQAGGILYIGDDGTGTLRIQNKSMLTSSVGRIGYFDGSNGTVTVTGGSKWTMTEELRLALSATSPARTGR